MQHNDIRHSMCYGCAAFIKNELSSTYICLESLAPLRVGKHKIPQKDRDCHGPHDDLSSIVSILDEFNNLTPEERQALSDALDLGTIDKQVSEGAKKTLRKALGHYHE